MDFRWCWNLCFFINIHVQYNRAEVDYWQKNTSCFFRCHLKSVWKNYETSPKTRVSYSDPLEIAWLQCLLLVVTSFFFSPVEVVPLPLPLQRQSLHPPAGTYSAWSTQSENKNQQCHTNPLLLKCKHWAGTREMGNAWNQAHRSSMVQTIAVPRHLTKHDTTSLSMALICKATEDFPWEMERMCSDFNCAALVARTATSVF